MTEKKATLCWSCANATGNCSWSQWKYPRPVKGWVAEKTIIKCSMKDEISSYCVIECPQFIRDAKNNGVTRLQRNI